MKLERFEDLQEETSAAREQADAQEERAARWRFALPISGTVVLATGIGAGFGSGLLMSM